MPTSAANYTSGAKTDPTRPGARVHHLDVPIDAAGWRLDQVLARLLPQHSRNRMKAWIEAGLVRVDATVVVAARHRLAGGESLTVTEGTGDAGEAVKAEAIGLAVAFEDDAILVIDKPAGLVVHPGSGNRAGQVVCRGKRGTHVHRGRSTGRHAADARGEEGAHARRTLPLRNDPVRVHHDRARNAASSAAKSAGSGASKRIVSPLAGCTSRRRCACSAWRRKASRARRLSNK